MAPRASQIPRETSAHGSAGETGPRPGAYGLDNAVVDVGEGFDERLRVAEGEANVNELAEPFDMSLPAISKHIKVLESAGLIVRGRRETSVRIAPTPVRLSFQTNAVARCTVKCIEFAAACNLLTVIGVRLASESRRSDCRQKQSQPRDARCGARQPLAAQFRVHFFHSTA